MEERIVRVMGGEPDCIVVTIEWNFEDPLGRSNYYCWETQVITTWSS